MEYLIIAIIGFIAFFLKGMTGTGTTTAVVGLSIFIVDPKSAIVLASFVNIFGGLYMIRQDKTKLPRQYWLPITITMVIGSIIGAQTLSSINPEIFHKILGLTFILVSLSFLRPKQYATSIPMPEKASHIDNAMGLIAGFCGGFIGINAPILIGYFGHFLNKQHLRRLLIIIFIPAGISQTVTFAANDLLTSQIALYGFAMLPGLIIGVYCGNRMFQKTSETIFKRILAVFLLGISLKLLFL